MEVICEKYKECIAERGAGFECNHSRPHQKLEGDLCDKKGSCGECNFLLLRKKKLKKLYDCNL